jgi:hypothetical protein
MRRCRDQHRTDDAADGRRRAAELDGGRLPEIVAVDDEILTTGGRPTARLMNRIADRGAKCAVAIARQDGNGVRSEICDPEIERAIGIQITDGQ